jgi:hypothetical protein
MQHVHPHYTPFISGHAPGDMRGAFIEGIEVLLDWQVGEPEPEVELRGRNVPIRTVVGLVWSSGDTLPRHARTTLEMLGIELRGSFSYAAAARRLKPWLDTHFK